MSLRHRPITKDQQSSIRSNKHSQGESSDKCPVENVNRTENIDSSWISATSTYNYMMKDPLLDWLKHHHSSLVHKHRKYREIVTKCIDDSKSSYNFTSYIMDQGISFEKKVMKLITKKFGSERIAEIHGESDPRNPDKVQETLEAMKRGVPIIHSGVLHNVENKTFGIPDILIRSDWVKFLVKDCPLTANEAKKSAPKLVDNDGNIPKWHYRVVDIKFTGLLLRADATHLLNSASFPAYKAQLLIYNWALGYLQGYTPDQVYILGRRWKYTAKGETYVGNTCFDKLAIINYKGSDSEYVTQTKKALEWLREVRSDDAADWNILNYPLDRWELYPNMCNSHDYPWHAVKQEISEHSKELTSLWMVGPKNRNLALEEGISQWTDRHCTPEVLGITGEKTSRILNEIIAINRSTKRKISPDYVTNNIGAWKQVDTIEFFVDFETCNGVVSSIKRLPSASTETVIFMIGVGYIDPDTNKWTYRDFTVNRLTFDEEERICREFSDFIRRKAQEYGVKQPRCIHWAQAEDIMWRDALERHDPISDDWMSWMWDWLDLLVVFKEEPIVINGCMSFGLKDVASAMKQHGFIETSWDKNSVCVDGQSAMVAARKAHNAARATGTTMRRIPVMNQIIKYNEVDVKVLYEIIHYLRKNHTVPPASSRKRSRDDTMETSNPSPKKSKSNKKKLTQSNDSDTSTPSSKKSKNDKKKLKRKRASSSEDDDLQAKRQKKNETFSEEELSIIEDMNDSEKTTLAMTDNQIQCLSRYNLRKRVEAHVNV